MITQSRIIEWYQHFDGKVYVSFSGGKDSTVLLDIVRKIYPEVPAVFCNTGLEYPQLQAFVRQQENVEIIYPKMSFSEVVSAYGYPIINKETAHAIYYARRHASPTPQSWKSTLSLRQTLLGTRWDTYVQETGRTSRVTTIQNRPADGDFSWGVRPPPPTAA